MVYRDDLKSSDESHEGSNPSSPTICVHCKYEIQYHWYNGKTKTPWCPLGYKSMYNKTCNGCLHPEHLAECPYVNCTCTLRYVVGDDFDNFLREMKTIHDKKKHDYSASDNRYSNFDIVTELVRHFKDPRDQPFVVLIGTKLARLSELLNGKEPNNESIHDTFVDLPNYCVLWAGSRERK